MNSVERMDKFGNTIYDRTWFRMCKNAEALENAGYTESERKPNLFYLSIVTSLRTTQTLLIDGGTFVQKKTTQVTFFADMRGTRQVKIWENTDPYLSWRFFELVPDWKKRRVIEAELRRLSELGCPCRLSYNQTSEPGGLMFSNEDGFCRHCGKDFQSDGRYCSDGCMKKVRQLLKELEEVCEGVRRRKLPTCSVCHEKLEHEQTIEHHVSYQPEETIKVCRSCHQKIHRAHRWTLKPPEGDSDKFYEQTKKEEDPEPQEDSEPRFKHLGWSFDLGW